MHYARAGLILCQDSKCSRQREGIKVFGVTADDIVAIAQTKRYQSPPAVRKGRRRFPVSCRPVRQLRHCWRAISRGKEEDRFLQVLRVGQDHIDFGQQTGGDPESKDDCPRPPCNLLHRCLPIAADIERASGSVGRRGGVRVSEGNRGTQPPELLD